MDTRARGDTSEAAAVYAFRRCGLRVWVPQSRFGPCDMMVENGVGEIARVQVKSGRVRGERVIANTRSTDHGRGRQPYTDHVDILVIHVEALGEQFVVPISEARGFDITLRLGPTRNNQLARFARDYRLVDWAARFAAQGAAEATVVYLHPEAASPSLPLPG